jgi:hypothetical protein
MTRFVRSWSPDGPFEHDIVMIGNRVVSRMPFKTMPGARLRQDLVKAFAKRYGRRFAVYGSGWQGPSAMGPCGFDDQQSVNASARVAVGVNNSSYPYVFSNRLPIALACGVPLIYSINPGFDKVFGNHLGHRLFEGTVNALAQAEMLLTSDPEALQQESAANRSFFEGNLTTDVVAEYVISESLKGKPPSSHASSSERALRAPRTWPFWRQVPPLISDGRVDV